jgi:hypothetical protein
MKIPLTAGQAVTVYSWIRPKETLTWLDILANEKLTFSFLNKNANISRELLHRLQPDIAAWVSARRVCMADAPQLATWEAHPIRDLKADLGDIIDLHWPAEKMAKMGVNYQDLLEIGMTPETMGLFQYTLFDWSTLGFDKTHAEKIPGPQLARMFNLTKQDIMKCLK